MKKILLFLITIISFQINAQEYLMQNGSVTTCSGTLFDSGGDFENYANDENFVYTICPEDLGQRIKLDFLVFNSQLGTDVLTIYDGNDTSGDVIGNYSGAVSPDVVFASFDNISGCLTFEFSSDGAGTTSGWVAQISCLTPCQNITAQLDSTNPLPNGDDIIEVCVGDNITFNGSGIFEIDGTGATYEWELGDGTTAMGESVTISYNQPGVYLVDLNIRDTNTDNFEDGCPDGNTINQIVRVSGEPDYSGVQAADNTLCFGDTTTIEAEVNPLTLIYNCPPPESEATFLPDGSGAAYSTCINVTCFDPSAVLTDVSQIFDICLNMEHSYSGDLDIKIISPNGQEAVIFAQGGGGIYFGGANDNESIDPGVGADYCFSMSASTLLVDANTIIAGSNPPSPSWIPGTYLPVDSYESLVGSPLNGEWCIEIVDNLAIDNGYIFSWELNFDESVPQEDFTFIPEFTSQSWDASPTITETNGTTITVAPDGSGLYCYTYRTVDIFGCEHTEEVCITVADENEPPVTYYEDVDGDGFGDETSFIIECSDMAPPGYVTNDRDCEDDDALINPDADDPEGDGIDTNCDGVDGDLLSVEDININELSIRPNPFKETIFIDVSPQLNGNSFEIKIYDLNGRAVYDQTQIAINGVVIINGLNELTKAPYFLNISNVEFGIDVTKKLIKL